MNTIASPAVAGAWDRAAAEMNNLAWNIAPESRAAFQALLGLLGMTPADFEVDESDGQIAVRWHDSALGPCSVAIHFVSKDRLVVIASDLRSNGTIEDTSNDA